MSGAPVNPMFGSLANRAKIRCRRRWSVTTWQREASAVFTDVSDSIETVKFDTDKLPPILNALETVNNGQKLVLEVAVRQDI